MQIHFVRSGGLGGMRLQARIDGSALTEAEFDALQQEIEQARFFDLPAEMRSPKPHADRFQYQIELEDGRRKHTASFDEAAVPDQVWPLIRHLVRLARRLR